MHLGFFEPKKHGGDCWLHGGLEPPCVSDVFTEGHLLVQCLCWIGFLVSETGSVMMQLRMILNLYSSYIYVYRPRGSNMHPPVSSRHVQPQRIHENYLCILDQTGSSLCITKMHDAVQVSVYIYIYIIKFGFIDILSFDYEQSVPEPHVAFPKCTWWLSRGSPWKMKSIRLSDL